MTELFFALFFLVAVMARLLVDEQMFILARIQHRHMPGIIRHISSE